MAGSFFYFLDIVNPARVSRSIAAGVNSVVFVSRSTFAVKSVISLLVWLIMWEVVTIAYNWGRVVIIGLIS